MTNVLKLKPNIVLREEGDEGFIFDADSGSIKLVNELGVFILKLCDGSHTEEDIIDCIMEEYDVSSREIAQSDLMGFISTLAACNTFEQELGANI